MKGVANWSTPLILLFFNLVVFKFRIFSSKLSIQNGRIMPLLILLY